MIPSRLLSLITLTVFALSAQVIAVNDNIPVFDPPDAVVPVITSTKTANEHHSFGSLPRDGKWRYQNDNDDPIVGPRDRFWRHHSEERSLVWDGVNQFDNIDHCWKKQLRNEGILEDYYNDQISPRRQVVDTVSEYVNYFEDDDENTSTSSDDDYDSSEDEEEEKELTFLTYAVVLDDAIKHSHARAVQSLARCVRTYLPHLYESRAMYKEMGLPGEDDEEPFGGNCPTHLAPLVSLFLPEVFREQQRVLQVAYDTAGWKWYTDRDMERVGAGKHGHVSLEQRAEIGMPPPNKVGVRASEHLTYSDFPTLGDHTDGTSKYTMNFAFSGPEDYDGGEFYLIGQNPKRPGKLTYMKPKKYGAVVFLGGRYLHGVSDITGGHREMFSTEFWNYPDLPFGSTLWSAIDDNMEQYIEMCNEELEQGRGPPCMAPFPNMTAAEAMRISEQHQRQQQLKKQRPQSGQRKGAGKTTPKPLVPVRYRDEGTGKEYNMGDFKSEQMEPDFLVPAKLETGEMMPIRWRDNLEPVDGEDGESFVIGFPPELHQEFTQYVEQSGMMELARSILYKEKQLRDGEHRIYTLNDGHKWGAMIPGDWRTDMIWLDPADEECFESLVSMLGRGGFDTVLEKVGKEFDLEGLMIQGVGAIFLSHKKKSSNMHRDLPGSKGSFYNVIVPVYIPEDETATFYVGEEGDEDEDYEEGTICLDPNVGVVLGGESLHGTGECDYREKEEFRLSFAIYLADINRKNVDLIASDSTSLWPTQGDTDWFWSQRGRFWSRDGTKSIKGDTGRKQLHVEDLHSSCPTRKDLCESDPLGWRLKCPKTCKLYLEDDGYYKSLLGAKHPL